MRTKNGEEQRTVARLWADEKDKGRKTTTEVLAAWSEAAEIDPSDFWQWIEITRLHQEAGDLTAAASKAQSAINSARTDRDRSSSLEELGNVAVRQGRLDDARRAYEEFRDVARQLLTANPSSAEAKRDVSVSLEKVGNVAMSQGRLDEARWAYEQSLAFARQLLASNPSSAEAKRDVSISLQKVGDVAVSQGRLDDAGRAYEEDLDLARQLLASNPSSAQAKRDVLVSNWKLALIPGQEQNWRDALAIAKDMAAKGVLVPADQWMMPELQRQVDALDAHK